jgi:hypothetical protein
MPVAMLLAVSLYSTLFSGGPARACTVFCDGQGDTVLAGRSFDIPSNPHLGLLFAPATTNTHGWFSCGYFDYPYADGMNDQNLFVAVADVPTPFTSKSPAPPTDLQTFINKLLGNCASVEEAIAWCRKQPTPSLGADVTHTDQGDYTYTTPQHILVADRTGDSVVFEWPKGKLQMTRKRGRYQLMTNFLLSNPKAGDYPCPRFIADSKIFKTADSPSLQTCLQVLEITSVESTRYSLLCDLTHGDVNVYLRRNFGQPKTFHLAVELQQGRRELDLDQWFGRQKPELLSPPPVISQSTLSAAEILQRSLTARGGEKAAAQIHSLHAKGTLDLNAASIPALPFDYFAMRPDRFHAIAQLVIPNGQNLGSYTSGFDDGTGWNSSPTGPVKILKGEPYDMRKDEAEFFGWYVPPADFGTAECLGQAQIDGKLCYDLKVVSSSSHREYFEYYDATNFLFTAVFAHKSAEEGSGWARTIYGDYQSFDGFLMPMRFDIKDDTGHHSVQLSSVEINTVKDKDLRLAMKQTHSKR